MTESVVQVVPREREGCFWAVISRSGGRRTVLPARKGAFPSAEAQREAILAKGLRVGRPLTPDEFDLALEAVGLRRGRRIVERRKAGGFELLSEFLLQLHPCACGRWVTTGAGLGANPEEEAECLRDFPEVLVVASFTEGGTNPPSCQECQKTAEEEWHETQRKRGEEETLAVLRAWANRPRPVEPQSHDAWLYEVNRAETFS